jgi:hypothetical protein
MPRGKKKRNATMARTPEEYAAEAMKGVGPQLYEAVHSLATAVAKSAVAAAMKDVREDVLQEILAKLK